MGTMEARQALLAKAHQLALIGAGGMGIWLCGGLVGSGLAAEPSEPETSNVATPPRRASPALIVAAGPEPRHAPKPYLFFSGSERRATPPSMGPPQASATIPKTEARTPPLGYLFFVPGKKPPAGTPAPTTQTTAAEPVGSKAGAGLDATKEHRLATRRPGLLFFTPTKAKAGGRDGKRAENGRAAEASPSAGSAAPTAARAPTPRASLEPKPRRQPEAPRRVPHHDLGLPSQRPARDRLTSGSLENLRFSSSRPPPASNGRTDPAPKTPRTPVPHRAPQAAHRPRTGPVTPSLNLTKTRGLDSPAFTVMK